MCLGSTQRIRYAAYLDGLDGQGELHSSVFVHNGDNAITQLADHGCAAESKGNEQGRPIPHNNFRWCLSIGYCGCTKPRRRVTLNALPPLANNMTWEIIFELSNQLRAQASLKALAVEVNQICGRSLDCDPRAMLALVVTIIAMPIGNGSNQA